jgi:hypothetical protein
MFVTKTIRLAFVVLMIALVIVGQSQIFSSSVGSEFQKFEVDGKSVAMIDPSNELQTPLPIFRRNGHVWIAVRLIHAAVEEVVFDRYWNLFSIRGISFKIGAPEMHVSYPAPIADKLNGTDRHQLPVASTNFDGLWYVPLEPVMQALGHSVSLGTTVSIKRGASPNTLLDWIKPFQASK